MNRATFLRGCLLGAAWMAAPRAPARAESIRAAARPEVFPLPGGARLVVAYEPDSPLVAMDVFFRVGYAEERAPGAGITALLANAWISSTEGRTEALLGKDITELGGNVGSRFGGDYTEVWAVTIATPEAVERAAATLVFNLIGRPDFGAAAVEEARGEQLRALELENDPPTINALSRLRARVWGGLSPYARSPLGTPETVRALTPEQVRAFYRTYFTPDRAVIVVAGNITAEAARRLVEKNMGGSGWTERPHSPAVVPIAPQTVPPGFPDLEVNRRAGVTYLMAGFLTPGTQSAADYPALLLLDALIGGGKSARMFRNLRDTRSLGYETGTLFQPGLYQGLLAGYLATPAYRMDPRGIRSVVDEARQALLGEMTSLLTRPPDKDELDRARALAAGRYALQHQRLKDRSYLLGWAEVMGLGADFDANFDARLGAVTLEEVRKMATRVLGANHALVLTIPQ